MHIFSYFNTQCARDFQTSILSVTRALENVIKHILQLLITLKVMAYKYESSKVIKFDKKKFKS